MPIFRVIKADYGKLRYRHFRAQVMRTVGLLTLVVVPCAVGVYLLDRSHRSWPYKAFDAAWNAANVISTLGSFTALSHAQKGFILLAMLSLLAVGGYALTTLTGILTSADVLSYRENWRVTRMLEKIDNHIIIVGFQRLGEVLAEELKAKGVTVVVVERDADIAAIASERGYLVVQGSSDEETALQSAQIGTAKGLLLTTEDTARKLATTLMARALNPQLRIVVLAKTSSGRDWLTHAGASDVVLVDRLIAETLIGRLESGTKLA
jgi:voltage-gated potassium channel